MLAQITHKERIEIGNYKSVAIFDVKPISKESVLVILWNNKADQGMRQWSYQLYNSNLNLVASQKIEIDRRFELVETDTVENGILSLFRANNSEFAIAIIDRKNKTHTTATFRIPKDFWAIDHYFLDHQIVFSGESEFNSTPALLYFDLLTKETKLVPLIASNIFKNDMRVFAVNNIRKSKKIFVCTKVKNDSKKNPAAIQLFQLDHKGTILHSSIIHTEKGFYPLSSSIYEIEESKIIVSGTYTTYENYALSTGIYFGMIRSKDDDSLKFYNFLDLDNFLNYLPEKKKSKMEQKVAMKSRSGKQINALFKIDFHNVIFNEDGYIVVGEASYKSPMYGPFYIDEADPLATQQLEPCHKYTQGIIVKFSNDGTIQWDNFFILNAFHPISHYSNSSQNAYSDFEDLFSKVNIMPTPEYIIALSSDNSTLKMMYASGTRVYAKSINTLRGEVLKDNLSARYELLNHKDQLQEEKEDPYRSMNPNDSRSHLIHWQGEVFLAYGNQQIENNVDGDRNICFISKVIMED